MINTTFAETTIENSAFAINYIQNFLETPSTTTDWQTSTAFNTQGKYVLTYKFADKYANGLF